MKVSDGYTAAFCQKCGAYLVINGTTGEIKKCKMCGDKNAGKGQYTFPYAVKLLENYLGAAGMYMRSTYIFAEDYEEKLKTDAENFYKDDEIGFDDTFLSLEQKEV